MGRYSRIYVGKLGPYVRERELRERFEEFGPIVSVDLKRGYGFVEYEREKDADDAIYYMDRKYFDGATIIVEPARGTKRERPTTRGPPQRSEHRAKVYNLPRNMSWQDLKDHFRPVAEVIFAECFPGKKSATANIEFNTREEMKRAIDKFDRSSLEGDLIYVEEDTRRSRYSSPGRRSPVRSLSPRRSPLDSRSPRGSPRRSPRRSPSRSPRRSLSPRSPSPRRRSPSPGRSPRPSRDDRSPRRSPSPRRSLSPRRSRSPSPSDRKRRRSESPSGSPDPKRRRTSVDGEY